MILTHDPESRICIQIGLGGTAEYIYLAHPQWRKLLSKQKPLKRIPDALCDLDDNRHWHYYGIDGSFGSIVFCTARYSLLPQKQKKHVNWICTPIGDSPKFYALTYLPFRNPSEQKPEGFFVGHTRHLIFGMPFDWILQTLGIQEIDVLAIDIEGFESVLFANYNWEIRPKFIAIECHDEFNHLKGPPAGVDLAAREERLGNELAEIIQAQGYQLMRREPTNYNGKKYAKTMELQFLRDDLCE